MNNYKIYYDLGYKNIYIQADNTNEAINKFYDQFPNEFAIEIIKWENVDF